MGAPKGNQFWKLVKNPTGRPLKIESPEIMWKKACEYFEWCDNTPLETYESEISLKETKEKSKEYLRVYTIEGVYLYLGVTRQTFENYGTKDEYKEFFAVVGAIKNVVYKQKFEGASSGLFNANIIARDLGLADKKDITSDGEKITSTMVVNGIEIEIG